VQTSLGRPLSGGAANATVNIVAPGTMYGERLNEVDLRLSKLFKYNRTRWTINLDLFNALNGNAVNSLSSNYSNWQQPQGILAPRLAEISGRLDF
jgi:hypothetical protein